MCAVGGNGTLELYMKLKTVEIMPQELSRGEGTNMYAPYGPG